MLLRLRKRFLGVITLGGGCRFRLRRLLLLLLLALVLMRLIAGNSGHICFDEVVQVLKVSLIAVEFTKERNGRLSSTVIFLILKSCAGHLRGNIGLPKMKYET